ncbi:MAG: response regulator [Alphaproteobacteria bacterium]|nr:response regulator [Alphaproteobacteria bacterium]
MDLRPPSFASPFEDRIARILFVMLAGVSLGGVAYLVILVATGRWHALSWPAPTAILLFFVALGLLYARRLEASALVAAAGLVGVSVADCVLAGGPSAFPPLVPNLLMALALTGSVSGRRSLAVQTVAATLLVAALWWLEHAGWFPEATGSFAARAPVYGVLVVGVCGALVAMASHVIRTTLAEYDHAQRRLRELIDQMPDGLVSLDRDGVVTACNPAAAAIAGRPVQEILGHRFTDVIRHEDDQEVLREFRGLLAGEAPTLERRAVRRRDGTEVIVEINVSVVTAPGGAELRLVIRDLSERVRQERHRTELERQLLEARRLEAVGRLAGGVAHDFNNLLTVIISGAALLREERLSQDGESLLVELSAAARRAGDLTGQLLAFARRQVREPRVLDLSALVQKAHPLMQRLVREDIELAVVAAGSLPIFADPVQVEQILVNLVVNARDAMPAGGRMTVEAGRADLGDDYALRRAGVQPGTYALLAVADTGEGMDAETVAHAFEPFFSTKGSKGTGLGLATVHGIVKQSGGHVFVYSEVGEGTTFKVYLPVTDRPLVEDVPEVRLLSGPREGTILVVDDDPGVLTTTARVLKSAGYEVLAAHGPEEALALSQIHRGGIDLLLTDVVMPKMGGVALAERLTAARPGLKVLFASGYTENAIVHHGVLDPGVDFLAKPFTPPALITRVEQALAR